MSRKYWAGAVVAAATLAVFAQPALASAESCCLGRKGGEVVEVAASTGRYPKEVVPPVTVSAAAVQTAGNGCFWGCKIN
jgi:hypothetical protein